MKKTKDYATEIMKLSPLNYNKVVEIIREAQVNSFNAAINKVLETDRTVDKVEKLKQ